MNDPAALVVVPPVELAAPDIARWRAGNTGVDHVHRLRADAPGPVVHVQALTHGNEICGAIALDWLLQQVQAGWRPLRGTLTLAFANVEAYARFDPADPYPSRCVDEDLNRVWADAVLLGPRDSIELQRFGDDRYIREDRLGDPFGAFATAAAPSSTPPIPPIRATPTTP
ncbi:MAG: hypothetical protein RLZZ341_2611, partial [Pseudomonadota bacterium]